MELADQNQDRSLLASIYAIHKVFLSASPPAVGTQAVLAMETLYPETQYQFLEGCPEAP
jgi:hypothetical protein